MKLSYGNASIELTTAEAKEMGPGQVRDLLLKLKAAAGAIGERARKFIRRR